MKRVLILIALLLYPSVTDAAFTYVTATSKVWDGTGGATGPTAAINTSTAELIVIGQAGSGATSTPSDSQSNTWIPLTTYSNGSAAEPVRLFYCKPCITSASHTFTAATINSIAVVAFSLSVETQATVDQQNGDTANPVGTTITTGSVTPGSNNQALVSLAAWNLTRTASPDSGFTERSETLTSGGFSPSISIATEIQTTATTRNVTWTFSSFENNSAAIATFQETAAPAGPTHPRLGTHQLLGVGR